MTSPTDKKQPFRGALARRYSTRARLHRPVPWAGFAFSALNIVVLAFFVFDAPLGRAQKDLLPPLIGIAGYITDIGLLATILAATMAVLAASLLIRERLANARKRLRMTILAQKAAYLSLSVLSAATITEILKFIIGRARPALFDRYGILGFEPFNGAFVFESFPSGHATHIGTLFTGLALLFPRFRLLFAGLGLWLGATRIIIGAHYPSDVAAGLALGAWCALAMAMLFARFGLVFLTPASGWPIPRLIRRPVA